MIEDSVLLWKYKRGSKEALCRLYEKYRSDLLTVAVNLLGDTNSAEDVVQDVFVSFVRTAETFRLTGSLKGYLATCVANRSRDCIRKRQRKWAVLAKRDEPMISEASNPVQLVVHGEDLERLSLAMTQLPQPQREAIVLFLHGGLKFRQIAKFQDVPIKTAQSRFRCGLDKLRSILNGDR
ncbi:RNA polymerase sigma factor [Planctomycetota bacterium]